MAERKTLSVEVAYAPDPDRQVEIPLEVPAGTTLEEAVRLSGILEEFPDIDLGGRNKTGIYGKLAKLDTALQDRDRVEIYRPLIADPKAARRKRAEKKKTQAATEAAETSDA